MLARILVVDDNEVNVELLVVILASEHYVVSTAFDGFEALAVLNLGVGDGETVANAAVAAAQLPLPYELRAG